MANKKECVLLGEGCTGSDQGSILFCTNCDNCFCASCCANHIVESTKSSFDYMSEEEKVIAIQSKNYLPKMLSFIKCLHCRKNVSIDNCNGIISQIKKYLKQVRFVYFIANKRYIEMDEPILNSVNKNETKIIGDICISSPFDEVNTASKIIDNKKIKIVNSDKRVRQYDKKIIYVFNPDEPTVFLYHVR